MMETIVETPEELSAEAVRFVRSLAPSEAGATLITLSGELGAGKTVFVKAVAQALGVDETVTSPTFVLEKIYQLPLDSARDQLPQFRRLVHIDAYRLEREAELASLGFDELIQDSSNLIFLEWPERVNEALSAPASRITLRLNDDGSRTISYG